MNKNLCPICYTEFDKSLDYCPKCSSIFEKEEIDDIIEFFEANDLPKVELTGIKEGSGRKHQTGGEMCNLCPHCYGNGNWCPIMDDD